MIFSLNTSIHIHLSGWLVVGVELSKDERKNGREKIFFELSFLAGFISSFMTRNLKMRSTFHSTFKVSGYA